MDVFSNTTELRIQHVKQYVTIFDVLRTMGLDYPEATQQIRCPFHPDSQPSARVYADQNKVYCFTEGKGWDVVDAAQTIQQCSQADALAWLEQQFNVPAVTYSLQGVIRSQLTRRIPTDISQTVELVETRLKQHRSQLGFERYTRLLAALDLSVWEYSERKLKIDQFTARMGTILKALHA